MYCTGCGQQLVPGAVVCPRCGRPAGVAPVPVMYNRVHRHYQVLWVLWLVYAVWTLVRYLLTVPFLLGMSHGWFGYGHVPVEVWPFMNGHALWLLPVVTSMMMLRLLLSAVTGVALMQRKPWARVLAIVVAVLTLVRPITGTLLGIYTLWVLAPRLSGQEWDQITQPGAPPMQP